MYCSKSIATVPVYGSGLSFALPERLGQAGQLFSGLEDLASVQIIAPAHLVPSFILRQSWMSTCRLSSGKRVAEVMVVGVLNWTHGWGRSKTLDQ